MTRSSLSSLPNWQSGAGAPAIRAAPRPTPTADPRAARILSGHHPCSKMRPSMRPLLRPTLLATVASSLLATSAAWAQFDGGTTSSSLAPEDFFIRMQDVPDHTLSDFDVSRF